MSILGIFPETAVIECLNESVESVPCRQLREHLRNSQGGGVTLVNQGYLTRDGVLVHVLQARSSGG
jgi:hypothetical protein